MEKLLVIITVSLAISIVGLKIAEIYEYEDNKKAWENKEIGGKSSDLRPGRLKPYQVEEDSFSESRGSGPSLYGDDDYKYAPAEQ
jgi:hypothetical protein